MMANPEIELSAVVSAPDQNGPTLLLVDDDLAILEGVADLLELHGYNIVTATDGAEALRAMHEQAPDLVISDIMMREMDGYQFYEEVRKNPAWTMLPFIFLTARGQTIDPRMKVLSCPGSIQRARKVLHLKRLHIDIRISVGIKH